MSFVLWLVLDSVHTFGISNISQTVTIVRQVILSRMSIMPGHFPLYKHTQVVSLYRKYAYLFSLWTYTDGSCHTKKAVKLLGQMPTTPVRATLVWLNGAGITNTIGRAELAAIAAAIAHGHNYVATDSLTPSNVETIVEPRKAPPACQRRHPQNPF